MENMESPPQQPSQESHLLLTPLMISMAGIVATALAIVAYNFVLTRYCVSRRQDETSEAVQGNQAAVGVEEKELESIPILAYSSKQGGGLFHAEQSECAVCLGHLEEGEVVRLLPNCRHAFHLRCIDKWLASHSNCPLCRTPIMASMSVVLPVLGPVDMEVEEEDDDDDDDRHVQVQQNSSQGLGAGAGDAINISIGPGNSNALLQQSSSSSSSSSSSLVSKVGFLQSNSCRVESVRCLGCVSSVLMKSLSLLGMVHGGTSNRILPQ